MNWLEFVKITEQRIAESGKDPATLTVRIEVADSYYDSDVIESNILVRTYDNTDYLIIMNF